LTHFDPGHICEQEAPMPTYEYACSNCGNAWEEVQRITEPAVEVCPACQKSTAKRQISGGTFILKGGGWYSDLYSSPKSSASKDDGSAKTSDSGDKAKGETKTDAKPETKSESAVKGDGGSSSPTGGGSTGSGGSSKAAAE
jgi:putative FmdB family regulatory protein